MSGILSTENLNKVEIHKRHAQDAALETFFADQPKKAERLKSCGNFLTVDVYENAETSDLRRELKQGNFCKNRFCPMCAWRKARKFAGEMKSVFEQFQEREQGNVSFLLLTLTIKNPRLSELRASIKHMGESFQRLVQTKRFRDSVLGFVRAIEFLGDDTPAGQAHPHFHVILAVRADYLSGENYIKHAEWVFLWKEALRVDYEPSVNIQKIEAKNEKFSEVESALFETLKYCVAPQSLKNLSKRDFLRLDRETKGVRQYSKGGILKTLVPKSDELDTELWIFLGIEYYEWAQGRYNLTQSIATKNESNKSNDIRDLLRLMGMEPHEEILASIEL